jgi:hypothetical protein
MTLSPKYPHLVLAAAFCVMGWACARQDSFSAKGTVAAIERGKDGYTATLQAADGQRYQAVISRVNMGAGGAYREVAIGDKITVYGDTIRLQEGISIKVKQIKD